MSKCITANISDVTIVAVTVFEIALRFPYIYPLYKTSSSNAVNAPAMNRLPINSVKLVDVKLGAFLPSSNVIYSA